MTEQQKYVRPLSAESKGEAPARGRLKGRRILVVGGGQRVHDAATDPIGNGRAICTLAAREGAKVAVADINLESAQTTVSNILAEGGQAFAIQADVTKEDDVKRMLEEAHSGLGGMDGMVLAVGTFGRTGLANLRVKEDWDDLFAVNIRSHMLCCRDGLSKLDNGSSIVFISSVAGKRAGSMLVAYDATKAGLEGFEAACCLRSFPKRNPGQYCHARNGRHTQWSRYWRRSCLTGCYCNAASFCKAGNRLGDSIRHALSAVR